VATTGHFRVEARLIQVLGYQYHSTEDALKELVANAWDADATQIDISLPDPFTTDAIVITDNGYGMTPREIEAEYLAIAFDRRQSRGDRTPRGRLVRGFRGIGKFAGLVAADTMIVTSTSRGVQSRLELNREELEGRGEDLSQTPIPIEIAHGVDGSGTAIQLLHLRQSFSYPSGVKLGRLLLREFGRQDDFTIVVDGVQLHMDVLEGEHADIVFPLGNRGQVTGNLVLLDKARTVSDPGIVIRVRGRAIGPPTFFGLDQDENIPKSLLRRVYGEIFVDGLEEDVLANWAGFIENSDGYQHLVEAGRVWLSNRLATLQEADSGHAEDDFIASYADEITRLPPPKREVARQALMRIFKRFYDDSADRKKAIAEIVLNAFEIDAYWVLVSRIDEMPHDDVVALADLLEQWGLSEVTVVVERAYQRLRIVEAFEDLIRDPSTLELSQVHRALRDNAWLLGDQYELLKSNRTLRRIVQELSGGSYSGDRGSDRPDLILVNLQDRYLLVELKRPSYTLDRNDVAQAERYRDELRPRIPNGRIDVMVIGGRVNPNMLRDDHRDLVVTTFDEMVTATRARLDWLIQNLNLEPEPA
jgi:hypothetical protein